MYLRTRTWGVVFAVLAVGAGAAAAADCAKDEDCPAATPKCCTALDQFGATGACYDPATETCSDCQNTLHKVCDAKHPQCCHTVPAAPGAKCFDNATQICIPCGYGGSEICGAGAACCPHKGIGTDRCYPPGTGACCNNACGGEGGTYCEGPNAGCCGDCGACFNPDAGETCCGSGFHASVCKKGEACSDDGVCVPSV